VAGGRGFDSLRRPRTVTVLAFAGRPALAGQVGAAAPLAETDVGAILRALRDKPPPAPPDPNAPSQMFVIAP